MTIGFTGDSVQQAVTAALDALGRGEVPTERRHVDLKEEAGRRQPDGSILPGQPQNERAAAKLAPFVACMANSPAGGALIVGVADDGTVTGTELDVDWLQVRLYQLLHSKLTTVIAEHAIADRRVLVVRSPAAVEPIAYGGAVRWRVGDQCQEIDPSSWIARRSQGWATDWSDQPSDVPIEAVRDGAISVARAFLAASGDDRSEELAGATTRDLLRRLAVTTADGRLTRSGVIAFVGRGTPMLDYIRRPAAGADSEARVNLGRSLLEELSEVFTTARAYNPEVHVEKGLVIDRIRMLPERAVREAIVNGAAHREWTDPNPTLIEHIGATLRVTSPGGFYGGVRSDNIINHPSRSRNGALTRLLATLRIAEGQGIGVDRMFGDMIRLGHRQPTITEADGARVLAVLTGERLDNAWMSWLELFDTRVSGDLRILMSLDRLVQRWWVDPPDLAPYLQVITGEAEQTVEHLRHLTLKGRPATFDVQGVPSARATSVVGLQASAWRELKELSEQAGFVRRDPSRESVAESYARHAGRISTTELGSIVDAQPTNVGAVLRRLEEQGLLEPSRANRRGPGFFYRFVESPKGER